MPRRAHNRLYDAWVSDLFSRCDELFVTFDENVRACLQTERFGGENTDVFTVHRFIDGFGVWNDAKTLFFRFKECIDADRFDFGKNEVRLFTADYFQNGCFVLHVDDIASVGDVVCRSMLIAIYRDDFKTQSLGFDGDLFAEFSRSKEHDFFGVAFEWCAKFHDDCLCL